VLIGISSVVRSAVVSPTDYVLDTTHPEFGLTGLRVSSVLRMHKLVTVESSVIVRRLGHIGSQTQNEVDKLLRIVLKL
jgi:mRNA interferase MazF